MAKLNTRDNTPHHCWDCWKFQDCEQAQNMNAYTEPVDAYLGDAEFLCGDCAGPENEYIGDIGETDCPEHCAQCGVPLTHSLTTEGVKYLREVIETRLGCCAELWPVLYSDYLEETTS